MKRLAAIVLVVGAVAGLPRPAGASELQRLDSFEDLSGWTTSASEGARVEIAHDPGRDGMALRIDYDLPATGGWVLVRKAFPLSLPENFAFHFDLRAEAQQNDFEFKLVDPSGRNVWWRRNRDFTFPRDWTHVVVRRARIEPAWGVGGVPREVGFLEFGVATGSGGRGSVWIDNLSLEEREPASQYTRAATVRASTSVAGHEPERILDGNPSTTWRSGTVAEDQWVAIDLQRPREYGGLRIDWGSEDYATAYEVQTSDDGQAWVTAFRTVAGNGGRDYVYLPDGESRYLRLELRRSSRGKGYEIADVTIEPFEFSATPSQFFQAVAADAPPGMYPKYLYGRQTYWTVVGVDGDEKEALMNEEGMIEVDKASFSIEPFLYRGGELLSWNAVKTRPSLADGDLPIPTVTWEADRVRLSVTAFATGPPGSSVLYATYRVENRHTDHQHLTLFLAVRPFQVNPPWQSLNLQGGTAMIREISFDGRAVRVNGDKTLLPWPPPDRFGATSFERGSVTDFLLRDKVPPATEASDRFGFAEGVLAWGFDLPPAGAAEVAVAVPFYPEDGPWPEAPLEPAARLQEARRAWRERLDRVEVELPPEAAEIAAVLRSTVAWILINRDGPRLQPGSRNYARTWIRDGACISAALLELGFTEEVREFLRWYSRFQFADGGIPCCVDQRGADPVPEHDSHGEFLWAVAEYYRFTRDIGFVTEMWPHVVRAAEHIARLRAQRTTDAYRSGEKSIFYGLLPESISHEGYASKPVHSYWDDFFALRGLKDAVRLATAVGDEERAQRFGELAEAFRSDLLASIAKVREIRGLDYLPASADLGDFDPSATAIALDPGGELERLPADALRRTFDRYYADFLARRDGAPWDAFTPYELRNVAALIRLGERERAFQVLEFILENRRPREWNQWPEILWRDPQAPRFLGDIPHGWVGAGFVHAVRSALVFERESDRALVLAAGVPQHWLADGRRVAVKRMPTVFGVLAYSLERTGSGGLRLRVGGDLSPPPGGLVVRPPLAGRLRRVRVNGREIDTFSEDEAKFWDFPADVEMEVETAPPAPNENPQAGSGVS